MHTSLRFPVMAAALALVAPVNAAGRSKLAILDVKTTAVPAHLSSILTEILTTEVADLGAYDVIASSDIGTMLGFEKQKELAGCTDAACLADIGGALGVEYILASDVASVGKTYVVNIKLINIRKAQPEGRVYETVKGEEDALIDTIRRAVCRLLPGGERCAGAGTAPAIEKGTTAADTAAAPTAPVAPAAPSSTSPRPKHDMPARYGLFLGLGVVDDERDIETRSFGSTGPALPYFNFFYRSRYVDVDAGGAPPALKASFLSAAIALKPFRFGGLAVRYASVYDELNEARLTNNKLSCESHALAAGVLLTPLRDLRVALLFGPTLKAVANNEVNVSSTGTELRLAEYEVKGFMEFPGPTTNIEVEYFFTDHLAGRFSFFETGGEAKFSKLLGLSGPRLPPRTIYIDQKVWLFSLGYDFADVFGS